MTAADDGRSRTGCGEGQCAHDAGDDADTGLCETLCGLRVTSGLIRVLLSIGLLAVAGGFLVGIGGLVRVLVRAGVLAPVCSASGKSYFLLC